MYIIQWLFEAGPISVGAMGSEPLNWQSIKAWADLSGIDLQPSEAHALRHLSTAYLDQSQKAKDNACPPPWVDPDQLDRDKIADKVSSQFKALTNRRKSKRG